MMKEACIFNIQRYSLHDGGGIRSIVFFKGCPFTCPWCCNPESLSMKPQLFYKESLCMNCSKKVNGLCNNDPLDCPTGAKEIIGKWQSVEEVYDVIKRDQAFYETSGGGITLSGGECLLQIDFAIDLLKRCKENHIHTAIESTLALKVDRLAELVQLVDVFLVDFKIMDHQKSKEILNLDVSVMLNNVKWILEHGGHVIARIPLIPQYSATSENIEEMITQLKQLQLKEVHLLPFHQLGESKYKSIQKQYTCHDLKPLREKEVEMIEQRFKKEGFKCVINGN
ncbi:MAG: glycyl-radical enzyme activating protein [Erysipelotrichia bacterium]|nr:glycyl-radical enzyme activating protein [Erysipelotrichia bacterium]NCC54028.1 glycyl-radical enzyme activating protein [Erysipelotrichia bacterium]